jgi:hypothetical protein
MKPKFLVIALLALSSACVRAQSDHGIAWDPNPKMEAISEYRIYRLTGGSKHLEAIVFDPVYYPAKKGTYFVTAINVRGESDPSPEIKF